MRKKQRTPLPTLPTTVSTRATEQDEELEEALRMAAEARSASNTAWGRFKRNPLAVVALVVMALLIGMAIFAPLLVIHPPGELDLSKFNAPPEKGHWLGYDSIGRDNWSRIVYGARVSMSVGVFSVAVYTAIALVVGSVAGFFGGPVDLIISRIVDIMMCFPFFLLILTVAAALKPSVYNIILLIGLLGWTGMSRLVRAQILSVKEMDFVLAAESVGVPTKRILMSHVMPNALTPVLVSAPMGVAGAIMAEAGLSFLGVGVQEPMPSWGAMMTFAMELPILQTMPWRWIPPALMLSLTTLSANFAADGLRDAMDPKATLK